MRLTGLIGNPDASHHGFALTVVERAHGSSDNHAFLISRHQIAVLALDLKRCAVDYRGSGPAPATLH
jgi:hypothetical protein